MVTIIVGGYSGAGVYRNLTENREDPHAVLVELLDYGGPHDYTILAVGQSGYVEVKTSAQQVSGHVEGRLRGSAAKSVKGSWVCRLSAPSATSSITPPPSVPATPSS
jgi:hypothetical protein